MHANWERDGHCDASVFSSVFAFKAGSFTVLSLVSMLVEMNEATVHFPKEGFL
jgi:hypothetical protein